MSNISLTSNGFMDGTSAVRRNNDIIQIQAVLEEDKEKHGDRVYTLVTRMDEETRSLLEEQNILLKIMIAHLAKLTEISISEEEVDEFN